MADIKWVNGLRARRNDNAPDWAIAKLTFHKKEFIEWLHDQPDDEIYVEVLRAKSTGNLYAKIDEDQREYQEKMRAEGIANAKAVIEQKEIPEDDIPF